MADEIKVTINLSQPNNADSTGFGSNQGKNDNQSDDTPVDVVTIQNSRKAAQAELTSSAIIETVNILTSQANFELDFYIQKNDDYILQRNIQYAQQGISRAASVASSAISYAISGAQAGGVWGAVAGAAVGLTLGVAKLAQNDVNAKRMQDYRLEQMDTQLDFTRSRSGASYATKAASIGEDL